MNKKKILTIITAFVFFFTGCGKNSSEDTKISGDGIDQKINELAKKESEVLAENEDIWNKVFKNADKNNIDKKMDYDKYLEGLVEKSKDELSAGDMEKINEDLEKIRALEEDLNKLEKDLGDDKNLDMSKKEKFPDFVAKDFEDNDISSDIFKEKSLTLVNFWYNGCAPCVGELKALDKLNDEDENLQVIGINTGASEKNQLKEAKEILKKQGVKYKNLRLDPESELGKYASNIMTYPKTLLVDKEGNIIGDPIMGSVDSKESMKELKEKIENIKKAS